MPTQLAHEEQLEEIVYPDVGQRSSGVLGETLVVRGYRRHSPAIRLKENYQSHWVNFAFSAGTVLTLHARHADGTGIYIGPAKGGIVKPDGTQVGTPYGLGVRDDGTVVSSYAINTAVKEPAGQKVAFEPTQAVIETTENLRREFLYSGRDDKALFFTYREFVGDMARPAFTQNVTYALSDGSTIGFKDLRLEVLKATNTQIDYRVLKGF